MKQDNYTAKLIIRGLPKMEELEMRDLIIWLEYKVKELRDEYSKPLPKYGLSPKNHDAKEITVECVESSFQLRSQRAQELFV